MTGIEKSCALHAKQLKETGKLYVTRPLWKQK